MLPLRGRARGGGESRHLSTTRCALGGARLRTTTTGDSDSVTTINPFHIISAEHTIIARLSTWCASCARANHARDAADVGTRRRWAALAWRLRMSRSVWYMSTTCADAIGLRRGRARRREGGRDRVHGRSDVLRRRGLRRHVARPPAAPRRAPAAATKPRPTRRRR